MNLVKQIREASGLAKIKLLKEFTALENNTNLPLEELETIKAVLENPSATYDDYKQLEEAISIVEENEDQLSDNILYNEVINLLEDLVDGGTVADSITGIGLFDEATMDRAKNKVREFMTYRAWKRAVKELDKYAEFTGDEDIDGAFK